MESHHSGTREETMFPRLAKLLLTRKKKILHIATLLDSPVSTSWEGKKVHSLGQNPEAAVGSRSATKTEENRFTALLSRMGFPAMCLVSWAGLLTTRPVLSSRPETGRKQMMRKIQVTVRKNKRALSSRGTMPARSSVPWTMIWGDN